jgi:hypothetical protein
MNKAWVVTAAFVCSVSATGLAFAEEKGEKPNRIERTANRAVQGTENTAKRAGKFVEKTATRAGKFVEKTATKVDKSVRKALE